jgi:hypothetical protein
MSRCGSTLLGNVLDGSPRHLVVNQPGALQDGFWTWLTDDWTTTDSLDIEGQTADQEAIFRDLVTLILRRRSPAPVHGFIKFRSWAVLFLPFIRRAFPDVPCLFLYRAPEEVLGSVLQKKNVAAFATARQKAFLAKAGDADVEAMSEMAFMSRCYAAYFRHALGDRGDSMVMLNYDKLRPNALPLILDRVFSLEVDAAELEAMAERFRYYSKDPQAGRTDFDADRDRKAKKAKADQANVAAYSADLMQLYGELERSPRNLFADAGLSG